MKRILTITGLLILLMISSYAQPRVDFRLHIGYPEKHPVRYFDDRYIPSWAIREMQLAGVDREDMPIIYYIKAHSRYSLRHIYNLRFRGATWVQLSNWCGVALHSDNHDGPPYGNAYGHYKKHHDYSDAGWYDKHFRHDK